MAEKIVLSWSGGKDSALTLERLMYHGAYTVAGLFTVYNLQSGKVNLHNVPLTLIREQARGLGLPLFEVGISNDAPNTEYEEAHLELFHTLKKQGVQHIAFGDIFLEVIRNYRDTIAAKAGLTFHYPLWMEDREKLSSEFIERGFKAVITAVDADLLDDNFLGQQYGAAFISDLPDNVDICGENGEFHTFVWDGPIFSRPVNYKLGEIHQVNYRPKIEMKMSFVEIQAL